MIYSVMLNPAIDRTQIIPNFSVGCTQKVQSTRVFYAGKGLNVVRTLSLLGYPAACLAIMGQHDYLPYCQANPHLKIDTMPINGHTRNNITIIDPVNKTETHLREPGFSITKTTWHNFIDKFKNTIVAGDTVLLSGSLPPGAPEDAYARLIQIAHKKKAFSAIDSSGNALEHAIKASPNLVKINHRELDDWATATFKTSVSLDKAAQKLITNGIQQVTITCGPNGARSFSNQEIWQASFSKTIPTGINTVGCGDAFFGGLIAKLMDGKPLEETLKFATACGTANTLRPGAGAIHAEDIKNCLKSIITQKQS